MATTKQINAMSNSLIV